MLEHVVKKGIDCLGIEPSENVAKESNKYGVKTISEFFSTELANQVSRTHGHANVVYAANVFCHIPDINDLAEACSALLKDGGYLIFETLIWEMLLKKYHMIRFMMSMFTYSHAMLLKIYFLNMD